MSTEMTAALIILVGLVAVITAKHIQIKRLKHLLQTRTDLLNALIGASGAVSAEEVTEAGKALKQTVRRFDNPGLGERLDQEERRA